MPDNQQPIRRVTSRDVVRPYSKDDTALGECWFEPELVDAEKMSRDGWYVEDDDVEDGMKFEIGLRPDWDSLVRISNARRDQLRLAVHLKKPSSRFFVVLSAWGADDHPPRWEGRIPENFGSDFDIVVSVSVAHALTPIFGRPSDAAAVVASRRFAFSSRGQMFNIEFADFEARGWEPHALWHIDVLDVNSQPSEAVEILLNNRIAHYYSEDRTVNERTRAIFNEIVGAGIYADLARVIVMQGDLATDTNPRGAFRIVLGRLEAEAEVPSSTAIDLAENDPHQFTRVAQQSLQLASKL